MSRRDHADEMPKFQKPSAWDAGDRLEAPHKISRLADPRKRRQVLAKLDALLAARRS